MEWKFLFFFCFSHHEIQMCFVQMNFIKRENIDENSSAEMKTFYRKIHQNQFNWRFDKLNEMNPETIDYWLLIFCFFVVKEKKKKNKKLQMKVI